MSTTRCSLKPVQMFVCYETKHQLKQSRDIWISANRAHPREKSDFEHVSQSSHEQIKKQQRDINTPPHSTLSTPSGLKVTRLTCSETALKRQDPSLAIGFLYKSKRARYSSIAVSVKFPPPPPLFGALLAGPGFFLRLMLEEGII